MSKIEFRKDGNSHIASLRLQFCGLNGGPIKGTSASALVQAAIGNGIWALSFNAGGGMKAQTAQGPADSFEAGEAAIIAAIPAFIKGLYFSQPAGGRKVQSIGCAVGSFRFQF